MRDRLRRIAAHPMTQQLLGIDLRALAALRIGAGLLLLVNLATRSRFLVAHYTDLGAMPRQAVGAVGLYSFVDSPVLVALLFSIHAIFAVLLILGYRTWLADLICWVMLISLHQRNPVIVNAGDHILILMLFWGLFLPLGARASVDAAARSAPPRTERSELSPASVGLLLQIAYIYTFSALLKSALVWVQSANAVCYAVSLDMYTTRLGRSLQAFPAAGRLASRMTYLWEMFGPWIAFVPLWPVVLRTLTVAGFVGFHVILALTMKLQLFPYVCIVLWLVYLPSRVWDVVLAWAPVAALARGWSAVTGELAARIDALAERRPAWRPWPVSFEVPKLRDALAVVVVIYMTLANVASVHARAALPAIVDRIGNELFLDQHWNMFAPYPMRQDGWWVVPARLEDGREVDLFTGASPARWEKPELVSATYESGRWRKYLMRVWSEEKMRPQIVPYAKWLRYRWDVRHPAGSHVASMSVHYMLEYTQPNCEPPWTVDVLVYEWDDRGTDRLAPFAVTRTAQRSAEPSR